MNRYRTFGPRDDQPGNDGDSRFDGVNARLDPAVLAPGEVTSAVNCRFDAGRAVTRKGIGIMPWGARGYGIGPSTVLPYASPRLAEAYTDPLSAREWLLVVTDSGVWKTSPGTRGSAVPVTPGELVSGATSLIQTYVGMVMLRGAGQSPLYMPNVDTGWLALPAADAGKEALPPSTFGLYFQNRLFVVDARDDAAHSDTVWVSDLGAGTTALQGDTTYQSFKINQGSSDRLVGLAKFNETTLVCAKSKSIYVVSNIYGTNDAISQNARLDEVTRQYGCRSPRSFVQVGSDLWFMGHRRGVCSLRLTETNAMQGVDVPVSRDIQPLVDRINWEHADLIVAASHDNRVYFAVPLDDSADNNAILVYSTLTQKWAGYDYSAATKVRDFVRFTYAGAVRLGFVSTDGFICLYEHGYHDDTGNEAGVITHNPIATTVRTRSYGGSVPGTKRSLRLRVRAATWDGAFTVKAVFDGRNEQVQLANVVRDGAAYMRPYGASPWLPSNETGDWDTPWREDYAVHPADMQVTEAGGTGTVAYDVLQEVEEVWQISNVQCQHVGIEFGSTQGRLELASVLAQSRRGTGKDGTVS